MGIRDGILRADAGTTNFQIRDQVSEANDVVFTIESGTGNTGIGTSNPGSKLEIEDTSSANNVLLLQDSSGTCEAQPTTSGLTWSCSSDERLKENITSAENITLDYLDNIPLFDYTVRKTGERVLGSCCSRNSKKLS